MKHKGFTLIELLGVIVLLGVLALIAVPAIDKSLNSSKDNLEDTQESQIIKGAKDYYAEHLSELPQAEGASASKTITVKKLQEQGYLPLNITNPKTGELYPDTTLVRVTKNKENFKYKVE